MNRSSGAYSFQLKAQVGFVLRGLAESSGVSGCFRSSAAGVRPALVIIHLDTQPPATGTHSWRDDVLLLEVT